jgi:hypothetical protein
VDSCSEAEAALRESIEIGKQYRISSAVAAGADKLASRMLNSGDIEGAAQCFAEVQNWSSDLVDSMTRTDLRGLEARLALALGQPERARDIEDASLDAILADPVTTRRHSMLTYWIRLHLALDPLVLNAEVVDAFLHLCRQRSDCHGQDTPMYALALALIATKRSLEAQQAVASYVAGPRRDRRPVPAALLKVVETPAERLSLDTMDGRALLGWWT